MFARRSTTFAASWTATAVSWFHWDLRDSMIEADIEIILERTKERYPGVRPRVISDNGPQFIAKDFKEFIRLSGMTHVRTSPYYLQSTAKSNVGTNLSKGSAFGPGRRCRSGMHFVWWRVTYSITTTCVRTAPSATSRQRTCSPGISRRFRPSGIGSWTRRRNSERSAASGRRDG